MTVLVLALLAALVYGVSADAGLVAGLAALALLGLVLRSMHREGVTRADSTRLSHRRL
jgi:hypothetical protein